MKMWRKQRVVGVAATMLGLLLVLTVCGWLRCGEEGAVAAGVAVVTCGFALAAGRVVVLVLRGPQMGHIQAIGGMLLRMAIPLLICAVVYSGGRGPLVEGGMVYYLLVTYCIVLALETWLALEQAHAEGDVGR